MARTTEVEPRIINAIMDNVLRSQAWRNSRESNFYIQKELAPKGAKLLTEAGAAKPVTLERDCVIVFADDAPLFNWSHPARYLLHDPKTGELFSTVPTRLPADASPGVRNLQPFHVPVTFAKPAVVFPDRDFVFPLKPLVGNRYAILFSGMSDNRHTNDLEFLYRTLRSVYCVPATNIYVLNHDGTVNYNGGPKPVVSWPGTSTAYTMPVHGQGTKADFEGVIDDLKKRIKKQDSLLIHTNNHGDHDGTESNLCLYPSWGAYKASDFAAKVGELPQFRCMMVMMEQCRAGGFNPKILADSPALHTSVASACREDRNSIGGADFDPFARDWIAAMNGSDPYGSSLAHDPDTNHDGRVGAAEAFAYADSIHHSYDTPVYTSSSTTADACHLAVRWAFQVDPKLRQFLKTLKDRQWPPVPIPLPDPPPDWVDDIMTDIAKIEDEYAPKIKKLQDEMFASVTKAFEARVPS
jgi:hypothetical protein